MSGLKVNRAGLVGDQRWARPQVILALRQQMPAEHSELASHDLMAAPGADPHEKSMQWTGRLGRCSGRLDQDGARMTQPILSDTTVMARAPVPTAAPAVQPEIAHQLLRQLNRLISPIAATIPAATAKFTPIIVINRPGAFALVVESGRRRGEVERLSVVLPEVKPLEFS